MSLDSARTLFFKDYPQPQRCPICGGDVVPIYFGFGDTHRDFVYDSEGRQRCVWGGCVVIGEWKCLCCSHTFLK